MDSENPSNSSSNPPSDQGGDTSAADTTPRTASAPELTTPNAAPSAPAPAAEPQTTPSVVGDTVVAGKPSLFGDAGNMGRKKILTIGAVIAVVALGAAYVFGYYIPNKPENVYATAMERTGQGYDALADYLSDEKLSKKYETSETKGTFKFSSSDFSTDGQFQIKSDQQEALFSGDLGLGTARVKLEGIVKDAANSTSPDTYLKVSGIKGFGQAMGTPALDTLDGQWVAIDHTFLDNLVNQFNQPQAGSGTEIPEEKDIIDAYKVVGSVTKKYVFTSDEKRSIVTMREYVGKETVDGKDTMRFKVGPNQANMKSFIKELGSELDKTSVDTWTKANYGKSLSEFFDAENITKSVDDAKDKGDVELWVNTDTKMIHKIRFSDNKGYLEFGLNYGGGAEYPFFLKVQDKDGEFKMTATLNTKTDKITVLGDLKAAANMKGSFDMALTPGTGKVDAKAPSGSITLNDALNRIGLGGYLDLMTTALTQSVNDGLSGSATGSGQPLLGTGSEFDSYYNVQ